MVLHNPTEIVELGRNGVDNVAIPRKNTIVIHFRRYIVIASDEILPAKMQYQGTYLVE